MTTGRHRCHPPDTTARARMGLGLHDLETDADRAASQLLDAAERFEHAYLHREAVTALVATVTTGPPDADLLLRRAAASARSVRDERALILTAEGLALQSVRRGDPTAATTALRAAEHRRRAIGVPPPPWLAPQLAWLHSQVPPAEADAADGPLEGLITDLITRA